MALDDLQTNLLFFLRWVHIFSGIVWLGLLYFFNFVNVPFQGAIPKEVKPTVNPQLLPRALFWFRWGAMSTFLIGWLLLFAKYSHGHLWFDDSGALTARAIWILFGAILGTVMWFNVWFIIWPAQRQIIRWTRDGQSPPEMPKLAKRALLASRTNAFLSGPMLFGMIGPNNYGAINGVTMVACVAFGTLVIWLCIKGSAKAGSTI